MVVKINQKPVMVVEDDEKESKKGWVYVGISCVGYLLVFWILDYVCFTFLYIHPFPFVVWVGKTLAWLGSWL